MNKQYDSLRVAEQKRENNAAGTLVSLDTADPQGSPCPEQDRRSQVQAYHDPYIRAENEDDDGYDPYSDRRPERDPLFERSPWY